MTDTTMSIDPRTARVPITGGCQCGAVRYRIGAKIKDVTICHCRMCQKASGNYFQALAAVTCEEFRWAKGTPGAFRSSELVERDFCRDCGTPLTYRPLDGGDIWIAVGSLDCPADLQPARQYGIESQVVDLRVLAALPGTSTEQANEPDRLRRLASRQHPDHD
jgi:hypothetical protein